MLETQKHNILSDWKDLMRHYASCCSSTVWLKRETGCNDGHDNVKAVSQVSTSVGEGLSIRRESEGILRSTYKNRHRSAGVGNSRNNGAHDAHKTVECDADTISGGSVRGGQDLWCIGVEGTVIDIEAERDGAVEAQILRSRPDLSICEEENHCTRRSVDADNKKWNVMMVI